MTGARRAAWLIAGALLASVCSSPSRAQTVVTLWSYWADEQSKVAFVEEAARRFEAKNPGTKVRITWYQKGPLFAALQSALRARQGPDVFSADPDQSHYVDNGLLLPLDGLIDAGRLQDWAKQVWTYGGKLYGLPLEAQTVELYYNKDVARRLGLELPPGGQLSQADFLGLVQKARAAGIVPVVSGTGDRDYPGAYILHEALLKKLGSEDYERLLAGKLSYKDPRVVDCFRFMRQLVEAEAYPRSFASLKLGESHAYFYNNPGGLMLPMGSFYPSRAFNPPEKGGQPPGFPLGILSFPAMDSGACNECKTSRVGGSYVVNATSRNPKLAAALLDEMASPDMAKLWVSTVLGQTGAKVDIGSIATAHADYFKDLATANQGAKYVVGIPLDRLKGQCLDTYKQVMNSGLPGGMIGVDQAIELMDRACFAG